MVIHGQWDGKADTQRARIWCYVVSVGFLYGCRLEIGGGKAKRVLQTG